MWLVTRMMGQFVCYLFFLYCEGPDVFPEWTHTKDSDSFNYGRRKRQTGSRTRACFVNNCINRLKCGLTCLSAPRCACYTFYLLFGALALGFLYAYGMTLILQVSRLLRILIHFIFPASWLKSTKDIVQEALAKYSADRLGLADYALESAGGSILCNSETYFAKSGPLYSVFGIPLWYHTSSPREVIQPDVQPGKCWAMDGMQGYITIQLAMPIAVSAVSVEHIPKELAPSGRLDSAPKDFLVLGKERTLDSPDVVLGRFTYHAGQGPIQLFDIKDPYCMLKSNEPSTCGPNKQIFHIISFKFLNNHGNSEYTCIYRLRVHGRPLTSPYPPDM